MLWTWSQERDRNISKTCVFIFHHSIQHDEASGYIFYNIAEYQMNFLKSLEFLFNWTEKRQCSMVLNKTPSTLSKIPIRKPAHGTGLNILKT